jgi:kynurenine 3-monooxygenase
MNIMRIILFILAVLIPLSSVVSAWILSRPTTLSRSRPYLPQSQRQGLPYSKSPSHGGAAAAASSSSSGEVSTTNEALRDLKVVIVGGGPSGLLLAHRLAACGATLSILEKQEDYRGTSQRAYALGIGIRGRTAIQSARSDDDGSSPLWQAVKERGFSSSRFILHLGKFQVRLRDENDERRQDVEPSLLLFQTDLCRAMAEQLEARYCSNNANARSRRVEKIYLNEKVTRIDWARKEIFCEKSGRRVNFDLLVGCDGVNSIVRKSIADVFPAFECTQEAIPGVFKVFRLPSMPPLLDPTAVQLIFPSSGAVTAFVEPTVGASACVLLAGRNATDPLFASAVEGSPNNMTAVLLLQEELAKRYPKLIGAELDAAAQQLLQTPLAQASLVTCNTYHYGGVAVLVGDSAHATGGVSGQGVNSALFDSANLADCLEQYYDRKRKQESLEKALFEYSCIAVPEGKALYDLSFGPKSKSTWRRLKFAAKSALDVLFKGKLRIGDLPLQTKLTTSLESFASIRRSRDAYYDEPFPDNEFWNSTLTALDAKVKQTV